MEFQLSAELDALRGQVRQLMDEEVIPAEAELWAQDQRDESTLLHALQAKARSAGLWTPHLPETYGGRGLGIMGMCALFREMGRSIFGAKAFNCDAPNQGNMDLLRKAAHPAQQERYLAPLAAGEERVSGARSSAAAGGAITFPRVPPSSRPAVGRIRRFGSRFPPGA